MTPERQEKPGIINQKLGHTAFIFGNLSLAIAAITSACAGGEEKEPFQTPTSTVRLTDTPPPPTLTPPVTETPLPIPTVTPTPEISPEIEEEPTQVFTTDNLNVRSGPGLNFAVLDTMPKNTLGEILEGPTQSDGYSWWRITYEDGTDGWSAQDWLKIGRWPATEECDFSKSVTLRETTEYGIFGTDTFDTLVCGYLKLEEEEVFGEMTTTSYLAIVDASDDGFIQAVDSGIKMGNSVNRKGAYYYEFNLGCLKDGKITGTEYEGEKPYMDQETQQTILESSPERLVYLKLSFAPHPGRGCICCNLAHQIRLY